MYRCYTGTQTRLAEQPRLAAGDGATLMRTAARGLAHHILHLLRHRGRVYGSRVVGLVGKGNNGGDTLWALSFIAARGVAVTALPIAAAATDLHVAGRAAFESAGGRLTATIDPQADIVVDGIFGTGFAGTFDVPGYLAERQLKIPDATHIVACDVPSGVHTDTGRIAGASLVAQSTVTFGGPKVGLLAGAGAQHAGAVHVIDIGLGPELAGIEDPWWVAEHPDIAHYFGSPAWNVHKYSRGVLSVVAGSPEYPGAAVLVTTAAAATGIGYLTFVADPSDGNAVAPQVLAAVPQAVVQEVVSPKATAVVVGPGLGDMASAQAAVQTVLQHAAHRGLPILVDASGLDALAEDSFASGCAALVLTPHVGEMQRLIQRFVPEVAEESTVDQAKVFARRFGVWVVLKSDTTYVLGPEGQQSLHPPYTSELATAGTGDTLAGILGAGLATLNPADDTFDDDLFALLTAGVRLHSLSGQLAAADGGVEVSTLHDYIRRAKRYVLE